MKRIALLTVAVALAGPASAEAQTLTYGRAKAAVQRKADALAGRRTTVNTLLRQGPRRYYAQARWSYVDPTGCKGCAVAPDGMTLIDGPATVTCFAEFSARGSSRSRRVVVSVRSRACF
ncbi:MAG: hypothetical protein ACR2ML_09860 [Solirubrobacteraceae bacterium]